MISCPSNTGIVRRPSPRRALCARLSRIKRPSVLIALCLIAALVAYPQNRISEYAVKAAYLFNFGKFVRFASSDQVNSRQSFDLCILGDDPLGHTLDDLTANEQLDGKPARVVRLKSAADAHACSIAYISSSEAAHLTADLEALRGQPVLTVSDAPNFLQRGGMIQFILVDNHVRFAVNLNAVRIAQIGLSSELLKVATSVNGESSSAVRP
jgi:hypothetical protein